MHHAYARGVALGGGALDYTISCFRMTERVCFKNCPDFVIPLAGADTRAAR